MSTTRLQIGDEMQLGPFCRAAVIRLIELRVRYDIDQEKADLDEAEVKADKLENKKDGWFKDFRKGRSEKKAGQLKELIEQKQRWLEQWAAGAWKIVAQFEGVQLEELKETSLKQLREQIEASDELRFKRFLVLQEAVLVQIYTGFEGYDDDLEELDVKEGCDIMARHLGFSSKGGRKVRKEARALIKGSTGFWDQLGDELESLFKNDDLIDTGAGSSLGDMPSELLMTATAKLIGYTRFLADQVGEDRDAAVEIRVRVVDQFMGFKRKAERELVDGLIPQDKIKLALKNLEILEFAIRQLIDDVTAD